MGIININHNLFWSILGRFIGIFALISINSIAAKNLNIEDFAFFNLILSIIPSSFIFLTFGQDLTSSKFLSTYEDKDNHKQNVIKVFLLIFFIGSIPIILFFNKIVDFFSGNTTLTLSIILIIIFSSILRILSDYLRANNNFKYFIFFNSIRSSGGLIVWSLFLIQITGLLLFQLFSIETIFYSMAFSCFFALTLLLVIKRSIVFNFLNKKFSLFKIDKKFKIYFKSSLFIASSSFLVMLKSDYDAWIVSAFGGTNELAFYAPVIKIAVLLMVPLSIFESLMPKNISLYYHSKDRKSLEHYIRSINTFMFYCSFLLLIILLIFSKSVLLILFGEKFIHLDLVLKCVILSFLPKILLGPCGQILVLTKYEKVNLFVNLSFLISSVILGIILTNHFGYYGMIATYMMGIILINITFYIFVLKKLKINTLPYFNFLKVDFTTLNK